MENPSRLAFDSQRKFGLEIELNSQDGRDFCKFPLRKGEKPEGLPYVCRLIGKITGRAAIGTTYHHTHNNPYWIVKPDRSCGMEVCTPVSSGWRDGLQSICRVIQGFSEDANIQADERCSLHVHVGVDDLSDFQLASVLAYWIKCEPVFFDSVYHDRHRNSYCQCIGLSDVIKAEDEVDLGIINLLGQHKYYSVNTWHLRLRKRKTVEFRLMGREGCIDPFVLKNWTKLMINFVNMTKNLPLPTNYCWLDPKEVFSILGFRGLELSAGMEQTRKWFLSRLHNQVPNGGVGSWTLERSLSMIETNHLIDELGYDRTDLVAFPTDAYAEVFVKGLD